MWNLVLVHLETVLVSAQDRCTVCAERMVRLGMVLVLVQDRCMICAKHAIGSEIILDALDGTPR